MKEKNLLIKNAINFSENVDFNFISKLLNRNNFESYVANNWLNAYILNSVFKILLSQFTFWVICSEQIT